MLQANDIAISMDCKGRWIDNVFVERLWRSVKYQEVYQRWSRFFGHRLKWKNCSILAFERSSDHEAIPS